MIAHPPKPSKTAGLGSVQHHSSLSRRADSREHSSDPDKVALPLHGWQRIRSHSFFPTFNYPRVQVGSFVWGYTD